MRKNQKLIGIVLSYGGEAVKILTSLLYTPIMLRLAGQSEYGLYQIVYSVVSYLGLLNLGFGSAYIRYYSKCKVKDDKEGITRLNGMFMTIFLVISVISLLCGGIIVQNARLVFGDGLTNEELDKARVLMKLMVGNLAITFPNSVFSCIVTSNERFFFQKLLVFLQNLLNPFLALPLLIMGYGSIGMVLATTILTIAAFLINGYYCIKVLHAKFIFSHFQLKLLREMMAFTFFIFLNKIIDQINWSIDKFLLGRFKGTATVAVYGIGAQLNSMYVSTSTAVSSVFVPQVNRIVVQRDDDALSELFIKVGRMQFIILSLVLSGIVFFGKPFIALWAGQEYLEAYYVTLLLIVPVTIPLIQNLGIEIQRAKNMHKTRSIVYFLIAVSNVLISIPLIKMYGVIGAAFGTALSLIAGNILFMNWYYSNRMGLNILGFWKNIILIGKGLIAPCVAGCIINLLSDESIWTWTQFFGVVVVYALIFVVSMYCFGINEQEKGYVKGLFRRLHIR